MEGSADVDVEDHGPLSRLDLPEADRLRVEGLADNAHASPGIVDQGVEPAEALQRGVPREVAVGGLRNVGGDPDETSRAEAFVGFPLHRVQGRRVAYAGHEHATSRGKQGHRHRLAEAAAAAGHDGHLVVQHFQSLR